ncbi:MAG: hypothetical protein ACPL3P_08215 [Anaerolineales bacterium]
MAYKTWETYKTFYCPHAGRETSLEVEVIYPAEFLPDSQPKILAHRCSNGLICNLTDKASCVWSGTNPVYDPFIDKG